MPTSGTPPADSVVDSNNRNLGKIPAWVKDIEDYLSEGLLQKIQNGQLTIHSEDNLKAFLEETYDLSHNEQNVTRILVGSKGTGKTLSLVSKAVHAVANTAVDVLPKVHPYHCRMINKSVWINYSDPDVLKVYREHQTWYTIWKTVFMSLYVMHIVQPSQQGKDWARPWWDVKNSHETAFFETAQEILKTVEKQYREDPLSPLLRVLLARPYVERDWDRWLQKTIVAYRTALSKMQTAPKPVVIVVDALDEALADGNKEKISGANGTLVWVAAQTGLIDAIHDLGASTNQHLRIYAGIREEAYRRYFWVGQKGMAQVDGEFCVKLHYSSEALKHIFALNVDRMNFENLANRDTTDAVLRFFGTKQFRHSHVWDRFESPLDWLIRHTLGRPRDLVWLGHELAGKVPPAKRNNRPAVSAVINEVAAKIFRDYCGKLIPAWDNRINVAFSLFRSNVISVVEANRIQIEFARIVRTQRNKTRTSKREAPEYVGESDVSEGSAASGPDVGNVPNVFRYLWQRGLLGVPDAVQAGSSRVVQQTGVVDFVQSFSSPGTWDEDDLGEMGEATNEAILDAPYYVLHPCLSAFISEKRLGVSKQQFISSLFVAGPGQTCFEELEEARIILERERAAQRIEVSLVTGPNPEDRRVIEALSGGETQVKILFVAICCAMFVTQRATVGIDVITKQADRLRLDQLINEFVSSRGGGDGNGLSQRPDHFLRRTLSYESGNVPHVVRTLKDVLSSLEVSGASKLSLVDPMYGSGREFGITGISPGQINVHIFHFEGS